jgi:hypothetical protein
VIESSRPQSVKNGQVAQPTLTECRVRVFVILGQVPGGIASLLQPHDPAAKPAAAVEEL